jgi:hypothetical protein
MEPDRRYIKVTTRFEGFHRWPNAPDSEKFLRNQHRHLFHVYVTIAVFHDDRELEFFAFKNWLEEHGVGPIKESLSATNDSYSSCEDIANDIGEAILKHYGHRYVAVEVYEDGENGGIVVWE